MICILALIIFAVLAIFSASYRPLAAEAFDCVFRRITFRKCHSGLDKRLKGQITGKVMKRNKKVGRFVYKYFEVFSWFFLILLMLSLVQTGISVYNYAAYGNCNGPDETGFCIFDPLGTHQEQVSVCADEEVPQICPPGVAAENCDFLKPPELFDIITNPKTGKASAPVTVIEFGCFACPNTAEQAPAVQKIIEHYGSEIQFIYVDFPLESHAYAKEAAIAAQCVYEQNKLAYWQYHFTIFANQELLSNESLRLWAEELSIDMNQYDACIIDPSTAASVDMDSSLAVESGVFGTPTFFINDEPLVGVKSYKLLKVKIDDALEANN